MGAVVHRCYVKCNGDALDNPLWVALRKPGPPAQAATALVTRQLNFANPIATEATSIILAYRPSSSVCGSWLPAAAGGSGKTGKGYLFERCGIPPTGAPYRPHGTQDLRADYVFEDAASCFCASCTQEMKPSLE